MPFSVHLELERIERDKFTGSIKLFYDHGRLVKLVRCETTNLLPLPLAGVWPPAGRETRGCDRVVESEREKG